MTAIAGIDYGCAQFLLPMLGLRSTASHLLMIYALLLFSQTVLNHFSAHWVAWLNDASVPVHIAGVVILVGALLIFAPKQPLHFLLQASSSSGIHAPYAWLFLLGLLPLAASAADRPGQTFLLKPSDLPKPYATQDQLSWRL